MEQFCPKTHKIQLAATGKILVFSLVLTKPLLLDTLYILVLAENHFPQVKKLASLECFQITFLSYGILRQIY